MDDIILHESWERHLRPELQAPYMQDLFAFLKSEEAQGKDIYPPRDDWFRALNLTPLDDVRVVILGQDPYHGAGQAHGLCFSVPPDIRTPPSLKNIYKELHSDLGVLPAPHGFLESWAKQGVLLINSVLTVEAGKPASHQKRGWESFTDAIIALLASQETPIVFMLWGAYAQKKAAFVKDVDEGGRHMILQAAHPSPLAAYNGFFGCKHFSACNAFLSNNGDVEINWTLPAISQSEFSFHCD